MMAGMQFHRLNRFANLPGSPLCAWQSLSALGLDVSDCSYFIALDAAI